MAATRTERFAVRLRSLTAGLAMLAVCCQLGCGSAKKGNLPSTHEVKGTVVSADGKPLPGGMIELRTTEGRPLSALGTIQSDGTFTLTTMIDGEKLPGAVAGAHQVTVMPTPADTQSVQAVMQPVPVPAPVQVKPGDGNELKIQLPPAR
jgi:hypothetical protein